MMSLDDRAANRQPNAHTAALGCVEGIKKLFHALVIETHTGIPHDQAHKVAVFSFCSDQQVPRSVVNTNHRVGRIAEQVQDDLLELDTIACYGWKVLG